MSTTAQQTESFEKRYYERIRSNPAILNQIGNVALNGYEKRRYDETHSAVVEALKGTVDTHYTFEVRNGQIVAEEGELVEKLMWRGRQKDLALAASDPFFAQFLPERNAAEMAEFFEQQKMVNGQTNYNTIVTASPYSEEFSGNETARHKLKQAGQKPQFKRSMIRVSHWDGRQLHIFTRSVDNSSVELIKESFSESLGYDFQAQNSTQMLSERLRLNVNDDSWRPLAEKITNSTDKILTRKRGGQWRQGRPEASAVNLNHFVSGHREVIQEIIGIGQELALSHDNYESYRRAFEAEFYNYVALLAERLEQGAIEPIVNIRAAAGAAGSVASANGVVFDMCGMVLGPNANAQASTGQQTGFESLKRLENKKISCPECNNKVVVPKEYLDKGQLYCTDCGYGVDVCTGQKFSKSVAKKEKPKSPDIFDRLKAEMARYDQQKKLAEAERQATAKNN